MAQEKKWTLIYGDEEFSTFEPQLIAELLTDDRSNRHLLLDKYAENDLPDDPIRLLIASLTVNQRTVYNGRITANNIATPTKLEYLTDPFSDKVDAYEAHIKQFGEANEDSGITRAKYTVYKTNRKTHLDHETRIWKICMKTLKKTKHLMTKTVQGAGRSLLKLLRDENRLNVTQKDRDELFDQFMNLKMLPDEYSDVKIYYDRLNSLKKSIENAREDPQPISDHFHKKIYIAGLRIYPLYDAGLKEIPKLEEQTLDYVHKRMITVCAKTKRMIQRMHTRQKGEATLAAAAASAAPPPTQLTQPNLDTPPSARKSHNGKTHMPDCQTYIRERRCADGHANCPYNHPVLPRLSKSDWEALLKKYPRKKKQRAPANPNNNNRNNNRNANNNNRQQWLGSATRKVPNRVCNYILFGKPCPYGARCTFLHSIPPPPPAQTATAGNVLAQQQLVPLPPFQFYQPPPMYCPPANALPQAPPAPTAQPAPVQPTPPAPPQPTPTQPPVGIPRAYKFSTSYMMRAAPSSVPDVPDDDDLPELDDDDTETMATTAHVTVPTVAHLPSDTILVDSGATHLVTPDYSDLHNPKVSPITTITGINGMKSVKLYQGSVYIYGHWFHNALCVPEAGNKLIPIAAILELFGGDVAMSKTNCRHFSPNNEITVLGPCIQQGLYVLHALRKRLLKIPQFYQSGIYLPRHQKVVSIMDLWNQGSKPLTNQNTASSTTNQNIESALIPKNRIRLSPPLASNQ